MTEIIQKSSFVTELIVVNDYGAREEVNTLMATLTVSDLAESATIAPQLSLMFFRCSDKNCIDYTAYLGMLKSRWTSKGCALKTAALATEGSGPNTATLHGLHALRKEGLDLLLLKGREARSEMSRLAYAVTWN
jgi:hypothetical protein